MQKFHFLVLLLLVFSSCEIHKRKYRKGWYLEWANKKNTHNDSDKKEKVVSAYKNEREESIKKLNRDTLPGFSSKQNIDPPKVKTTTKTFSQSVIFSALKSSVAEIKKRSISNSIIQKNQKLPAKKPRLPFLPLYLLIAAPLFIFAAGVAANNLPFEAALLLFAVGVAAFILALVFALRYLRKAKKDETNLKRPGILYGIIIGICFFILFLLALAFLTLIYFLLRPL